MSQTPQNIIFFHPDLGIGGAERLVLDAALGLQSLGHTVTIFTSHRDPAHCFDEARDGTLDVRVRGNTLVPPSLFGRFAILCAILRQLHLILYIALFTSELASLHPTTFFVDQLSAGVPLLRALYPRVRILFYCHFPDKLLARRRSGLRGLVRGLYRVPFDGLERWSTGCADEIVVNSRFTGGVFGRAFPGLRGRAPEVVYPCVGSGGANEGNVGGSVGEGQGLWEGVKVVLSVNRFERKKDVGLAIRAYARLSAEERRRTRLVIAGGYDSRVAENVSYHKELVALAESLDLPSATAKNVTTALSTPSNISVLFLPSVPGPFKTDLLNTSRLLIYTPRNEHFGIVPLEAMQAGCPVLAANTGGPTETVIHGETGWLQDPDRVDEWTEVIRRVLYGMDEEALSEMGRASRARVRDEFSEERMARRLDGLIARMGARERKPLVGAFRMVVALLMSGAVFVAVLAVFLRWR